MRENSKIILDGKKGRLFFNGSCLELIDLCQAMCCREWSIRVTLEELETKKFKHVEALCSITNEKCDSEDIICANRKYRLKRNEDGSCIYLDSQNKCSIYEDRPKICRDFICKDGWSISGISMPADKKKRIDFNDGLKSYSDEMKFVLNPVINVKTVFYSKEKKEITFVSKSIRTCGYLNSTSNFIDMEIDDNNLMKLIHLFKKADLLKNIYRAFAKAYNKNLSKEDFYHLVRLLEDNNIILFVNTKS